VIQGDRGQAPGPGDLGEPVRRGVSLALIAAVGIIASFWVWIAAVMSVYSSSVRRRWRFPKIATMEAGRSAPGRVISTIHHLAQVGDVDGQVPGEPERVGKRENILDRHGDRAGVSPGIALMTVFAGDGTELAGDLSPERGMPRIRRAAMVSL
jgi:hypothetical protein